MHQEVNIFLLRVVIIPRDAAQTVTRGRLMTLPTCLGRCPWLFLAAKGHRTKLFTAATSIPHRPRRHEGEQAGEGATEKLHKARIRNLKYIAPKP